MKTYKEIKISTEPFDVDSVSGFLWELDIDGINEYDDNLTVFISEKRETTTADVENVLKNLIKEKFISSYSITVNTFEEKNWNEEYEKNVRVVEITDRIVIKPSFKEYQSKPNQILITIDPKMSFGTGEHATTKLVLQNLERVIIGGESVLDIGSGTGVLGIASIMLGASKAICVDNDEWCLLNGTENTKANLVEDNVDVRLGELKDIQENNFDVILANINKHILIDISPLIKEKIKKTGTLILSGLLNIDEKEITDLYKSLGFNYKTTTFQDEWISLLFTAE